MTSDHLSHLLIQHFNDSVVPYNAALPQFQQCWYSPLLQLASLKAARKSSKICQEVYSPSHMKSVIWPGQYWVMARLWGLIHFKGMLLSLDSMQFGDINVGAGMSKLSILFTHPLFKHSFPFSSHFSWRPIWITGRTMTLVNAFHFTPYLACLYADSGWAPIIHLLQGWLLRPTEICGLLAISCVMRQLTLRTFNIIAYSSAWFEEKAMQWKILKVWQKVTYSRTTWPQKFLQFH